VSADDVIMSHDNARRAGLTSTIVFPTGNLAPDGAVVKATAIDPSLVDGNGVFRHRGPARVFTDEREAIRAVKGETARPIRPGDVIVLVGVGPSGTGMQETAQITTALRFLPWGKHVALLTDARFSGLSTGACIGHIGPEALDGGPVGRVRDDDLIEIVIDRSQLTGSVNLVQVGDVPLDDDAATALLRSRTPHTGLAPHAQLPGDTRLWAALQRVSGGTWQAASSTSIGSSRCWTLAREALAGTAASETARINETVSNEGRRGCREQPAFRHADRRLGCARQSRRPARVPESKGLRRVGRQMRSKRRFTAPIGQQSLGRRSDLL
jgi:dihydroxyacid dehydratase/phosphogluconate dehydratase